MNRLLNTAKLDSTNNNLSISRNKREINFSPAFTVIELLVVIVVIAILAALTIVVYSNITKSALETSMRSNLSSSRTAIEGFKSINDKYPESIACSDSSSTNIYASKTNLCLKSGDNFSYQYVHNNDSNPKTFTLYAKSNLTDKDSNSVIILKVSDAVSAPTTIASIPKTCPNNFILVPGSSTYGTSDFCVMKYEAKIYGNDNGASSYLSSNLPNSRASGTPYQNITQPNAISQASKTVDAQGNTIAGAHLITEAEWMTIAQNVLQQSTNWSGGSVGSGFIYNGHVGNNPSSALAADSNDSNGSYGETSYNNSSSANNRRTLTLSNGEVIWDLGGNVWEWTEKTPTDAGILTAGTQPGLSTDSTFAWREWNTSGLLQNGLSSNSMPASTGIANINSLTSSNGIGRLYSNYNSTYAVAFVRSGNWAYGSSGGVLTLELNIMLGGITTGLGFRVVSPAQ